MQQAENTQQQHHFGSVGSTTLPHSNDPITDSRIHNVVSQAREIVKTQKKLGRVDVCQRLEEIQADIALFKAQNSLGRSKKGDCKKQIYRICKNRRMLSGPVYRDLYDKLSEITGINVRTEKKRRGYTSIMDYILDNGLVYQFLALVYTVDLGI